MSLKTSTTARLYIALNPSGTTDTERQLTELKNVTECTFGNSLKQETKTYYDDGGDETATTTGRALSLTASFDYDNTDTLHKYIKNLYYTNDIGATNNQYIEFSFPLLDNETTPMKSAGYACINITKGFPNGSPTEVIGFTLEIKPQAGKGVWSFTSATEATTTTKATTTK